MRCPDTYVGRIPILIDGGCKHRFESGNHRLEGFGVSLGPTVLQLGVALPVTYGRIAMRPYIAHLGIVCG